MKRRGFSSNAAEMIPRKNFDTVDKVLKSALNRFGLANDIARYKFVLHWKEIVGEHIAKRTKPECINRETLIVRVVDSAWAQELAFQKDVILSRLQKFLGEKDRVRDIHFYVGPLSNRT